MANDLNGQIQKIAAQQKTGGGALGKQIAAIAAQQKGTGASTTNYAALGGGGSDTSAKKPQTPVGWVLDMLDRPGNSIRNAIYHEAQAYSPDPEDQKKSQGLLNSGGAVGIVNALARGFFSTDQADKHTTSDIIEKVTDNVGMNQAKANGTKYNNTANNANPWVKGIGGFIGDVALDPTTYIPGVDLLSVGNKVVKGVKAGTEAAKAIEDASVASKAVSAAKAVKAAVVKTKAPTVAEDILQQTAKQGDDLAKTVADSAAPSVEKAVPTEVPVAPVAKPVTPSDLKPDLPTEPDIAPMSKADWDAQQIATLPDKVKVGNVILNRDDIAKAHGGNGDRLLPEEQRAATSWIRKNLSDANYQAGVKAGVKATATPEQRAAVAALAQPGVDDKVVALASSEAVKNISKGVKADPTGNFSFNDIDQAKMLHGVGSAGARTQEGLNNMLVRRRGGAVPNGTGAVVNHARNVVNHMKAVFDTVEAKGTPVTTDGVNLRLDDVMQRMSEHNPRSIGWFVNGTGRPDARKVLQAARDAAYAPPTMSDAELTKSLLPKLQAAVKRSPGGGTMERAGKVARPGYAVTSQEIAKELTDALVAKRSDIAADVAARTQYWADKNGAGSLNIANGLVQNLTALKEGANVGDYIKALTSLPGDAAKYAEDMGVARSAAAAAQDAARRAVPNVDLEQAKAISNTVSDMQKATTTVQKPAVAIDAAAMAGQKSSLKNAYTAMDDAAEDIAQAAAEVGGAVEDFGPKAAQQMIAAHGGALWGLLSKFKADLTAGPYFDIYRGAESLTQHWLSPVAKALSGFAKFPAQARSDAFKALQTGADTAALDPATAQAAEAIRETVGKLFDVDDTGSLVNDAFLRQGANMNEANRYIRNDAYRFDMDAAAERASINGTDLFSELANDWKYKNIDDPIDYLLHMHQGMIQQSAMHSAAQTFLRNAADNGLSSATKKAGFVRINPEKNSYLAPYLDRNLYYDKNAITSFRDVDRLVSEFRNVNHVPQIIHTFDSLQNMWKIGMTSLRPGFHIRNAIGDTALTMLDVPLIKPKQITNAIKVLNAHGTYDGFDAIKVLRNAGESELTGKGDKVLSPTLKGGKKTSLTNEDVFRLAKNEGLLGEFGQLEGLINTQGSAVDAVTKAIGSTLPGKALKGTTHVANTVATFETHHARLVHFMSLLERDAKKFDNVTSLAEYAAKRVKRFHPDPSMLSPFEKKYMRRIIPFYSWQRAILPLVAESLLTRPGRTMLYPKASYNLAVSLGVDPYSMSQPFPENDLLPSFVTNQAVGPVANVNGKNYTITPGIATTDTLGDYVGSNPIRTAAGSLTPALKTPIELLTGTNLQTGGKIKDTTDYLLNQIPGANYVNKLSDDTKTPEDKGLTVANWLTGLGIQDVDKDSYKKFAQYEQQQKQNGGN